MGQELKYGACNLIKDYTCPAGRKWNRCCYACDQHDTCIEACQNKTEKCGQYKGFSVKEKMMEKIREEAKMMQEDFANGMNVKEIARKYKMSVGCVHYRLHKNV